MRTKKAIKRPILPDPVYNDIYVAKFINHLMKDGKKTIARNILYKTFEKIEEAQQKNSLEVFKMALQNVAPYVEVISRRIGGATYQIPKDVRPQRRISLAMRWLIEAARNKKGSPMFERLKDEIIKASKGEGMAIKKKLDIQKLAEANKAFAHLAW